MTATKCKWTPGPWKVTDSGFGVEVVSVDGRSIACLRDTKNAYADANLISAVPELLRLVREAQRAWADDDWHDWDKNACAAIAKATGGE